MGPTAVEANEAVRSQLPGATGIGQVPRYWKITELEFLWFPA